MRRLLALLLLILLLTSVAEAAKKKKKKKKPAKPVKQTEQVVRDEEAAETDKVAKKEEPKAEKQTAKAKSDELQPVENISDEMEAYRAIQHRKEATVQDLADLLLMYRGEYGKIKSQAKRLERARELDLVQKHSGEEKLDRGTVAYAIMRIYKPEQGLLFWLTGWERYAIRDVQEAGIMPSKATAGQHLSGEQLLGTISSAEEYVAAEKNWGK
ncbi:MAG: hypothetical protein JNJ69_12565 [Leptospiraceae bacterium]|nr:hypothetical protein [Leptospiraceae bacterium]